MFANVTFHGDGRSDLHDFGTLAVVMAVWGDAVDWRILHVQMIQKAR